MAMFICVLLWTVTLYKEARKEWLYYQLKYFMHAYICLYLFLKSDTFVLI